MVGKVLCEREKSLVTHTGATSTMSTTNFPIWVSGAATFRFDDINFAFDNTPITTSYTYNSANELTSMTKYGAATSFAYDAWGRQTSKTRGSSSAAYAYRYGDKLHSVTSNFPGEGNVTYNYGGDGKRRERIAGGTTMRYNWDIGWNVLNEENAAGTLTNTYIHDPSRAIGTILADVSGSNPATGAYRYYSQDNIGSTRRLRDQNKASLGQYEYEPYGTNYAELGPVITHKFTGHECDPAAQLYFAPYRYYAPNLARWMSRDPLGMVDGPNLYLYAKGNAVLYLDPLGASAFAIALPAAGGCALIDGPLPIGDVIAVVILILAACSNRPDPVLGEGYHCSVGTPDQFPLPPHLEDPKSCEYICRKVPMPFKIACLIFCAISRWPGGD